MNLILVLLYRIYSIILKDIVNIPLISVPSLTFYHHSLGSEWNFVHVKIEGLATLVYPHTLIMVFVTEFINSKNSIEFGHLTL